VLALAFGRRARGLSAAVTQLWRRPLFAAAVAGTVAAAFPLALLLGGNAHTFALWHDADQVAGSAITAGDLDLDAEEGWTKWSQVVKVAAPGDTGYVPTGQSGNCLTAEDKNEPGQCSDTDTSLPLDQFPAMPGDKIELQGQFTTVLQGDNIAAILKVDWAALDEANPKAVTATYDIAVKDTKDTAASFALVKSDLPVGEDFKVITISAEEYRNDMADAIVLPNGIHQASCLTWQVTVTFEVKDSSDGADPYPYKWVDPLKPNDDPATSFKVPAVTWELEQVRAGQGWGVPIP
jgi:hypothetical protein